ncbi:MAG TPA: dihydroorotate dehydrogenase electron transfer subunit [Xanthobacteraceae bacterium]|nr:dihydroorotate dehydrogenase electron transfer subunit [Xanthobacteraceae bacterium]
MSRELNDNYTNSALRAGDKDNYPQRRVGEFIGTVVSNDWVNTEYKHVILRVHEHACKAYAGQMFHLLCPSPDGAEVWMRRPMSVYRVDKKTGQIEFLYKSTGRGTRGMATLEPGDDFNIAGPLGVGFHLAPDWKNIVVLGRGVGLATLAPLSQLAAERNVGVTAILSARHEGVVMSRELFEGIGARVITVLDSDNSSAVENVETLLRQLIQQGKADAFFTCGSNRLLKLMQRLGKEHDIPGQVAMEQNMVCGFGACYVCMRTFEVDGKRVLRRVCRDGPVFNMQEAVGW